MRKGRVAYFWGKSLCIIFGKEGINSIHISEHGLIDYNLSNEISQTIDPADLSIGPGITLDMEWKDLQKAFGREGGQPDYQVDVINNGLEYQFNFSSYSSNGSAPKYKLHQIVLSKTAEADSEDGSIDDLILLP